jgi:hypothetical protein
LAAGYSFEILQRPHAVNHKKSVAAAYDKKSAYDPNPLSTQLEANYLVEEMALPLVK